MEKLIKIGFIYENFNINKNSTRCRKNFVYHDKKKTIIDMLKLLFSPSKEKSGAFLLGIIRSFSLSNGHLDFIFFLLIL